MRTKLRLNKILIISCIILVLPKTLFSSNSGDIPILNFQQFEPNLHFSNDTIYIVNFWATWCVPCRKELPDFEKINQDYTGKPVKVLLVSLDFPKDIESSLKPFLEKNAITADVLLLNDPNSNAWIDKVDTSWSGSLPATLIYNKSKRIFLEKELDYNTIQNIISEIINQKNN